MPFAATDFLPNVGRACRHRLILKEPADFFRLQQYKEQIVQKSGFGEKSYNNLIESIENAKKTTPRRLLYGLGIKGIGAGTAALISGKNNDDWNKIINLSKEELLQIEGVGETLADAFVEFFENEETKNIARRVAASVERAALAPRPMTGTRPTVFRSLFFHYKVNMDIGKC